MEEAAAAILHADALLIVAAAGLSISPTAPNNPYHSSRDFLLHYPRAASYGYRTAYEAMTFGLDTNIPIGVRAAYTARHFLNMAENFPPTDGYQQLKDICDARFLSTGGQRSPQVFCWTSNADRCFERSGFPHDRIYTTQGDFSRYQCGSCQHVWPVLDHMRAIDAASVDGELKDLSKLLTCPKCGTVGDVPGKLYPNLRGGDWFIHAPFEGIQRRLVAWMRSCIHAASSSSPQHSVPPHNNNDAPPSSSASPFKIVVFEIGVGPNTPVVTAIPSCSFAAAVAAAGGEVTHIRINPDRRCAQFLPSLPSGNPKLRAFHFGTGWDGVLSSLRERVVTAAVDGAAADEKRKAKDAEISAVFVSAEANRCGTQLGDKESSLDDDIEEALIGAPPSFKRCLDILKSLR